MCRSSAEGGQRCYSHSWREYERASEAAAKRSLQLGHLQTDPEAEQRVHTALVDLASTPKGVEWIQDRQAASKFPDIEQPYYESVLRQGALIAERNKALGAATKKVRGARLLAVAEVISRRAEPGWRPPEERQLREQFRDEADAQVIAETLARIPADHPDHVFLEPRMARFRLGTSPIPAAHDL